ncbi:MAG: hypothetical protein AAF415_08785 [Pseudomonadota bacterium]
MRLPLLACLAIATLSACAEPARVTGMTVSRQAELVPKTSPLANAICVKRVTGGEKTDPLWTSEVDSPSFEQALNLSLANNNLKGTSTCAFDLNANLLGLAQPTAGFNMTVTSNVNYSLLERQSQAPYFQTTVKTPFTAEFGTAFAGVERLRLANEGSIRANISQFLGELIEHQKTTTPPEPAVPSS